MQKIFSAPFGVPGFALLASVFVLSTGHAAGLEGDIKKVAASDRALVNIVSELATFKTFRKTQAEFQQVLHDVCQRTNEIKDESGIVSRYACSQASGIERVRIDTRRDKLGSYVMTLSVYYNYAAYARVRSAVERQLGTRSTKTGDMVLWRDASDPHLNKLGNPVIYVDRDADTKTASFELGLEQGP
ncbi:hypothetical protein [Massilia sp. TN1-12]|uniref:hypothetical protein n=1 Tax=Massilia paldalensis TaxID=3377675 RepID=UPI00384CC25F